MKTYLQKPNSMKKILLASAAMLAFGVAQAEIKTVTFNFNAPGTLDPAQVCDVAGQDGAVDVDNLTFTAGDVTLVSVKGSNTTSPRLWKNGDYDPHMRVYAGNLTTFAVAQGAITEIKFNMVYDSPNCVQSIDEGGSVSEVTYGTKTVEWAGETSKIVFHWQKYSNSGKDYSPQINSIEVTYDTDGEGPVTPPTPPTPPTGADVATFNFNAPGTLNPAQVCDVAGQDGAVDVDNVTFTNNGITLVTVKGSNSTPPRIWKNGTYDPHMRVYAGNLTTIAAAAGTITDIKFNMVYDSPNCVQSIDEGGSVSEVTYGSKTVEWAGETSKIVFHWQKYSNNGNEYSPQINSIEVSFSAEGGINEVMTVNPNAPVEYFNLQGVRVANPVAGQIVIRRQGNTATKVIF